MRADFQVLVIPYILENNELKVAIFKRKNEKYWQFISGGGEQNETLLEAAKRESLEEASINKTNNFIKLDSMTTISKINFNEHSKRKDIYVIPEYSFCVKLDNKKIKISNEHISFKWIIYKNALKMLKYDSNKTALWELKERINDNIIIK